eukprot:1383239-Rhodomonas_salina.1
MQCPTVTGRKSVCGQAKLEPGRVKPEPRSCGTPTIMSLYSFKFAVVQGIKLVLPEISESGSLTERLQWFNG